MKFVNPYIFIIFVLVIGNTNAKSENIHLKYSPREDASFLAEKSVIGIADNPSSIGLFLFIMEVKNELGNRYGRLLVISREGLNRHGTATWKCKCDCGNEIIVVGAVLRGTVLRPGQKSCGCAPRSVEGRRNVNRQSKRIFRQLRDSAKKRNLIFELKYEDFEILSKLKCHYCGKEPYEKRYAYYKARYTVGLDSDVSIMLNSIDRKDNKIGYVKGNCAPCCSRCNWMKSALTFQEFSDHIKSIYMNLNLNQQQLKC